MFRNVLIVKLAKLYTVNSMSFLSALYMLQYVPIVKMTLVIFYSKKKKKKEKNDPYSGMGEKCQSYGTKTPISIFSLGKGRESLRLQTLHKKLSKSALSALPPSTQIILIQTLCGRCTQKLTKIDQMQFTLPQLSHPSSNRRVHNLQLYFQFTTLARELTHRMKFV